MIMMCLLIALCMVAVINGEASKEFINDVVAQHNLYRKQHGVPDITENATISEFAQAWADSLAASGTFAHNKESKKYNYGENLSGMWDTATGKQHVDNLYVNEAKYYADNKWCGGEPDMAFDSFKKYGHYTQIVWKNSLQLGVGKAGGIVVLNYSPQGNYRNEYSTNVPCPIS